MSKLILSMVSTAVAWTVFSTAAETSSGVDIDAFIAPSFDRPALSPNGKRVAVLRTAKDRPYIEVFDLADKESITTYSSEEGRGIADFHWADDRTLLIQIAFGERFWTDGRNQVGWRRFDIERNSGKWLFHQKPREPLWPRGLIGKLRIEAFSDHFVPNAFDNDPNDVRVIFPDRRQSWVSRYDTANDRYQRIADVPGDIFDAHGDGRGRVLATWGYPPTTGTALRDQVQLLYRRDPSDAAAEFKTALAGHIDDFEVDIVAGGPREDTVYVLENAHGDNIGLSVLDLEDGSIKPLFRPARTDVIRSYLDAERSLYAVRHDDHYPQFAYPDPKHPAAELHRFAGAAFKNMNVEIVSLARNSPKAIFEVSGDREPGVYYLGELGKKRFTTLFSRAEAIDKDALAARHPIEFPATDGTRLTGYVTIPKGREKDRIPFVVLVRDELFPLPATWGFDYESQLYASFGLGVLEVNPRGTLGFGREFWAAAVGRVATVVPSDIADGVRYITGNNADPDRVCIVGRRWGAYVAMMSVIRRSKLYRCVVTISGIYDVAGIRKALPINGTRARFTSQIGYAEADDEAFREISPRYLAARVRTPLLLVEAKQFSENLPGQAREMMRSLRASEIPYELHEESTDRPNNMLTLASLRGAYGRIAEFLVAQTGSE